jgi:hypothetical protein
VGNEPSGSVSAAELAAEAAALQALLRGYDVGRDVYGPSFSATSDGRTSAFLAAVRGTGLTGFTTHRYPLGASCDLAAHLSKAAATSLANALTSVVRAKAAIADPSLLLVLEETAGAYDGGCDGITNRFASGFLWLATLAVSGTVGFDRVHRQDFAGWSFVQPPRGLSHYQLAGPPGWVNDTAVLNPHPDYFTSVLWKQLMGRRALRGKHVFLRVVRGP